MAQCPTGYAPRLFWPGSHFYGFMGSGRNLWRPLYSRAQRAPALLPRGSRPRVAISYKPAGFSLFLLLPSPAREIALLIFQSSTGSRRGQTPTTNRHHRHRLRFHALRQLFPSSALGTMVTPAFVSRRDRRVRCRTSCPSSKLKPSFFSRRPARSYPLTGSKGYVSKKMSSSESASLARREKRSH